MRRRHLLAVSLLVIGAAGPARAASSIGRVDRIEGAVTLIRAGHEQALAVGSELHEGDEVRTSARGRLLFQTTGGLMVVIGSDSSFSLSGWNVDPPSGRLDAFFGLLAGIARLVASEQGPPRAVNLETVTAIVSVRSTEWLVEAGADGTAVLSISGPVVVRGRVGGSVLLDTGMGTSVRPGSAPSQPSIWSEERRSRALARTTF